MLVLLELLAGDHLVKNNIVKLLLTTIGYLVGFRVNAEVFRGRLIFDHLQERG